MTKFADQLFDDLMREHGPALARTVPLAHPKRHITTRRTLLAGGGALAVAGAVAGALVAGSGTPAYAVTKNPDGTITIAVYQQAGIAQANARLRQLGDGQLVVVPVEAGCPKPLPPAVSVKGTRISTQFRVSRDGSVTVKAHGIPAGDILVVGMQADGHSRNAVSIVTSPPAPACISPPAPPSGHGGSEARLSACRGEPDTYASPSNAEKVAVELMTPPGLADPFKPSERTGWRLARVTRHRHGGDERFARQLPPASPCSLR